jgi:hypothetical protein
MSHALAAGAACTGVALALATSVGEWGRSASAFGRVVDELSYFTVQSNLLVAATTGALAVGLTGRSVLFRVLRLAGVVGIALTAVVYHVALAGQASSTGADLVADVLLHTVTPILCLADWSLFGPDERLPWRAVATGAAFPLSWAAYTLARGELVVDRLGRPYYPYGFVDVGAIGYGAVARNLGVLAVVVAALTAASWWVAGRLRRWRAGVAVQA